ncbi:MAG TPA: hypothetical protein VFU81_07140 [Thermomicrobiales bacterium]|nr:hypothetical protein [Thermomicrobiales bacterium]
MDPKRFDRLTRRLTTQPASRRGMLAVPAALIGMRLATPGGADAKKRCKPSKRCGKGCCGKNTCLPKKIDPNNGEIVSFACCSQSNLCHADAGDPLGNQCCYADERCNPGGDNNGNGLCCRTCNGGCCTSAEVCQDDQCVPLGTARLPRRRP